MADVFSGLQSASQLELDIIHGLDFGKIKAEHAVYLFLGDDHGRMIVRQPFGGQSQQEAVTQIIHLPVINFHNYLICVLSRLSRYASRAGVMPAMVPGSKGLFMPDWGTSCLKGTRPDSRQRVR